MEQTPSSPNRGPELPSVAPQSGGEALGAPRSPEVKTGDSAERQEQRGEAPAAAEQTVQPPPVVPTIPVVTPSDDDMVQPQATVSSPTVANDDDLIEKEWVDKAKKILTETKDDPYRREQEVSRLQADYLLKRYGRELGSS